METMQNIFQAALTQKIGWTLVHFVWQACAIGLLLAVLLKLLHKSSAHLRYLIACGGLALMVCAPVITLQMIHMPPHHPAPAVQPPADRSDTIAVTPLIADMPDIKIPPVSIPPAAAPALPWQDRFTHAMEAALPYIVAGWLAGVFGLSLWYLGGWTQLQKFRRRMIQPISPDLKAKLHQLAGRLGITRSVELVESALVQVPAVVGHLKPAILLPASALTGLSPQQLEAVLAHELAHIRRHDYLVNLLQTAVEILGFYHPAVWWVSRRIRIEREHCCDDLAVSVCQDRLFYAKALTTMAEIRAAHSAFALTITGPTLFDRIRRLLSADTNKEPKPGWIPSAIILLIVISLVIPVVMALASDEKADTVKNNGQFSSQSDSEMRDQLKAIAAKILARPNSPQYPRSGKGTATVKETFYDGPRENIVDFLFKEDMSRSDRFTMVNGKRDKRETVDIQGHNRGFYLEPTNIVSITTEARFPLKQDLGFGFQPAVFDCVRGPSLYEHITALANLKEPITCMGENGTQTKTEMDENGILTITVQSCNTEGDKWHKIFKLDTIKDYTLIYWRMGQEYKNAPQNNYVYECNINWKDYHGVFYVSTAKFEGDASWTTLDGKTTEYKKRIDVTIDEFTPNVEIDDSEFTLDALQIAPGTIVVDKIADEVYRYDPAKKVDQGDNAGQVKDDNVRVYPVNRNVSDFPETEDFSTPESAYAAINRIMAADDPEGWQHVSVKSLAERLSQKQNRKREIDPEWSKVVLNAKILEVRIKDDQAVVIAEFPQELSSKPIKNPIDYRHLILEDGKWLNTGENRYDTIEQARTKFDQAIQSQLKTKQEYNQVFEKSEELVQLADELFDKLRKADYEKILSYYDEQTGKWSRDGWEKLDLNYTVHTNWPGFALWVCRTFQDNPIQSVELGQVFISDKQIAEEPNLPAIPYKVTLQDGGILSGDLYFYYSNEKWQPAEGLDWHLQQNPIKNPQLPSADKDSIKQILTTSYILLVPSDLPLLAEIISANPSEPKIITPQKLDELFKSTQSVPEAKLLAAPKILANDGETVSVKTENAEDFGSIDLEIKNTIQPDRKTIRMDLAFSCSAGPSGVSTSAAAANSNTSSLSASVSTTSPPGPTLATASTVNSIAVSTTAVIPSGHAIVVAGTTPDNGQTTLVIVKPQIQEKPLPQTGILQSENNNSEIDEMDSTNARPDLDPNFDMVQPWIAITGNDSRFCKDFEEALNADLKNSDGSAIEKYQQFMDKYPDSPANAHLLNLMSAVYLRFNQYDQAREALEQAIQIAGEDRFVNTLEINLANAERMAGDLATAETRLQQVMSIPVPDTLEDSYAVTPQLFSAPFLLADVYQKMGDTTKADNLLKQTGDRAWQITQENPDIEWLPSYVGNAYQRRINLLLETQPENINAAYALAEELKEKLPHYTGMFDYNMVVSGIKNYQNLKSLKANEK